MSKDMKSYMARNCAEGYEFSESPFSSIGDLLTNNAAYSPFQFKDGKRSKANIIGGTKIIVLDIDKSCLTDEEIHLLLEEYNHFVARTSDPDNAYKFRVIIELDSIVDVNDQLWSAFIKEVGEELGLIVDILPKSQIFFSFEGRNILFQLEAEPLSCKPLLDRAFARLRDKPKPPRELPSSNKKSLLEDPRETFNFAFEAEQGERSRLTYRALAYAIDLGANEEYVTNLAHELNSYWSIPMNEERLVNTLITPALRRM